MNIIFLTLANININKSGIYDDLMRCFVSHGHSVYIVSPIERKHHQPTSMVNEGNAHYLHVHTLNIQKTNIVEKGVGTLLLEYQFCHAINHHLSNIKFDIILYSTPPITFANVVKNIKKSNPNAISYLLLKDIFPQNAVDLGMFSKNSLLYKYFRGKEKQLYKLSDFIGCTSPANIVFILKHNPEIKSSCVEIAPNSIEITTPKTINNQTRINLLKKYNIPQDKVLFIYGGNLGKPQGIPFLIKCLETNVQRSDCHFIIVGSGTEYKNLKNWYDTFAPKNVSLLYYLPKQDYDQLVQVSDVGLIFLDYKFTIPNTPSRILPYMQYKIPVITATDPNTDIGTIAEKNKFGFACLSNDISAFYQCIDKMLLANRKQMGENAYNYLCNNYSVEHTYQAIVSHIPHLQP